MIKCIVDTVFLYFHSGTLPLLIISMVVHWWLFSNFLNAGYLGYIAKRGVNVDNRYHFNHITDLFTLQQYRMK